MGRHISQTKAINTGTYLWYPHELAVMRACGNARAGRAFAGCPSKPSRDAPRGEKEAYAKDKYELRRWGPGFPPAGPAPTPAAAAPAPAQPTPAPAVAAPQQARTALPVTVPRRTAGLQHAKRTTALPPSSQDGLPVAPVPDLISLEEGDDATTPAASAQALAAFDLSINQRALPRPSAPESLASCGAWQRKTADVLAHFQQRPLAGATPAAGYGSWAPDAFFARYGL